MTSLRKLLVFAGNAISLFFARIITGLGLLFASTPFDETCCDRLQSGRLNPRYSTPKKNESSRSAIVWFFSEEGFCVFAGGFGENGWQNVVF
jgi:hypothetical protein